MLKKYFYIKFFALFGLFIFSSINIYSYSFNQNTINDLYNLKTTLYLANTDFDYKTYIENFYSSQKQKNLSEQEKYTVHSEILIQKLNFIQDKQVKKETILEMFELQSQIENFLTEQKDLSEYLLTTYADLESRLISNMSGGEMYKMSMESKRMYLKAISINKKFAPAYCGYGNWLYFAPSVAGGGYNAALKQFTKAIKNSTKDFDLFINYIYQSQVYLKLGNKNLCEKSMEKAEKIFPENNLTKLIRIKNEKGKCFFD